MVLCVMSIKSISFLLSQRCSYTYNKETIMNVNSRSQLCIKATVLAPPPLPPTYDNCCRLRIGSRSQYRYYRLVLYPATRKSSRRCPVAPAVSSSAQSAHFCGLTVVMLRVCCTRLLVYEHSL